MEHAEGNGRHDQRIVIEKKSADCSCPIQVCGFIQFRWYSLHTCNVDQDIKAKALPNRNNDGGEHSQLGVSQPAKTENSPSGYGHKCFKYSGTDKFPDKSNDNKAYDIGNIKSGSEKSFAFDLGFQKCGKKMASTFTISTVPMAQIKVYFSALTKAGSLVKSRI